MSRSLKPLVIFFSLLIGIFTLTRLGLVIFNGNFFSELPLVFGFGLIYDISIAMWFCLPLLFVWLCFSGNWPKIYRTLSLMIVFVLLNILSFTAISEFVFWNEFASRFNFIAVDYLIYSREVVGNIRESYSLPGLLTLVGVISVALTILWRSISRKGGAISQNPPKLMARALFSVGFISIASLLCWQIDTHWKERLEQPQKVQLAGNGVWEFFYAYRYNAIDYQQYYKNLPEQVAIQTLQKQYRHLTNNPNMPIERQVIAEKPALNPQHIILVSMESLGSEFIESQGGKPGLTPELEKLAKQGINFTQLYASGTRTVRGLEALTLSVPPTPGMAILMRPKHQNLFTLGKVLSQQGYRPMYLYGGYSYFDNMRGFFSSNGYTVKDRTDIPPSQITHETVWGVADEDLFNMAIKEIDQQTQQGQRVFAHIMTTSNHRPYTYPANKIDIPSGTGRKGAVKYADYAVGQFIKQASQRPWFNNSVFVFVADHTSIARGKQHLPLDKYHIPMIIYAPKFFPAQNVDTLMAQIDFAPTLLGLLNISYQSQFFGKDIFKESNDNNGVFLVDYQAVGFASNGYTVELTPGQKANIFDSEWPSGLPKHPVNKQDLENQAIAYYQLASKLFSSN